MKKLFLVLSLVLAQAVFSATAFAESREPVKDWTFAIYMNADNDLEEYGFADQEEMAEVGSNDLMNIVTLFDPYDECPTKINHIQNGKIETIRELGETDSGDYRLLVSFFREVAERFPARHYVLVIWSHGGGWKSPHEPYKWISHDFDSNKRFTLSELEIAAKEIHGILGRKIDILAMDACNMQMAEVASVLKDHCDYITASENREPRGGYPYNDILSSINAETNPESLAMTIVQSYGELYEKQINSEEDTTQSALRTSRLDDLFSAIDGLSKSLMCMKDSSVIAGIRKEVQPFSLSGSIDLADFARLLKERVSDSAVINAAKKLDNALNESIMLSVSKGPGMKNAGGLAIYFPKNGNVLDKSYFQTKFAAKSMWDNFLSDFFRKQMLAAIAEEAVKGDVSSLAEYIRNNCTRSAYLDMILAAKLEFGVLCEENSLDVQTRKLILDHVKLLK